MSAPVYNSILIQNVSPAVDGGLFPVKRRVGSAVTVSCEAFGHGHDPIKAILLYRCRGNKKWQERLMDCTNPGLDLFESSFKVEEVGFYEYSILGYVDHFENWRSDTCKKFAAGDDISSELLAGEKIFAECVSRAPQKSQKKFKKILTDFQSLKTYEEKVEKLLNEETLQAAVQYPKKTGVDIGFSQDFTVRVDRKKAEFASWYEMFPRSAGNVEGQSGTFKDVEKHLPYIAGMGFDVLYFTPIHPIGKTKRKGKNNSLVAEKNDPGSPYAIGDETGGHFAVHPELGTIDDFDALVEKCRESGIEIALDFALNCSPDHPYLNEKPDWFYRRPDGSIKFAENPPKKYEDIYPLNFECDDRKSLWQEICDSFLFWAEHGVRTFRVDNPHTKPIQFWQWCIVQVQKKFPDVIFLAEAFTKPRLLESLAKIGFTQSYGYFTWRETKAELEEYFDYLNDSPVKEYMLSNVFPTTPDIHPKHLHHAPREMFQIRLTLATTLSPVYGMYSGYELCENIPVENKDELLNSEKYEYKVRNFSQEGSLAPEITLLNKIRRENPALQEIGNLQFHHTSNENIICYSKKIVDNLLLICVNLDPKNEQSATIELPFRELGLGDNYQVHDLLDDAVYQWSGKENSVSMNPYKKQVAHIFRVF